MSGNAVQTVGTRLFIANTAICTTETAYKALTWTEVEEVEDIGTFGISAEKVTYKTLADGVVRKAKGTVDYGSPTLKLPRVPTGPGQAAIKAAAKDRNNAYNFKVEFDDAPDGGTATTIYMHAFVMSYTTEIGAADGIVRATVGLEVDAEPIEVAAAEAP
jgi:Phage tail protein.